MSDEKENVEETNSSNSITEFNESLNRLNKLMRKIEMNDPLKKYRELMQTVELADPMKKYRELMQTIEFADPLKKYKEIMQSVEFVNPLSHIQQSLNISNDKYSLKSLLESISRDKWTSAYSNIESDFVINEDGSVAMNSKVYSKNELQNIFNQITNDLTIRADRFENLVGILLEEIRKLKDSALQKILSFFIYPFLVGIIVNYVSSSFNIDILKVFPNGNKQFKKQINRSVNELVADKEILVSFRFVTSKYLNVRSSGEIKSRVIGVLYFGQVVQLIKKGRHWSLVLWRNEEEDLSIQGWVFSRYLEKFK
jgi:hypothetical protein